MSRVAEPLSAALVVAAGPRSAEKALLEDLDQLIAAGPLSPPVRVVVSSHSLRDHMARIVARRRGAVLGVRIDTLRALAVELAGRPRSGDRVLPLLVRRVLRRDRALGADLAELDDADLTLAASVRDLLDAGFRAEHLPAVTEVLADGESERDLRRLESVVRVAATVERQLAVLELDRASTLLDRATDRLRADPSALPARAILVHGFAETTGVVGDLLEALAARPATRVYLDRPPSPGVDGTAFTQRLQARLAGLSPLTRDAEPAAELSCRVASTREDEVALVASEVRRRLDDGVVAESIGIVLRDPRRDAISLRRQLRRHAVPFSVIGFSAPPGDRERRARDLGQLLSRGGRVLVDRWLDLVALPGGNEERESLRLGLRVLGASRLEDVPKVQDHPLMRSGRSDLRLPGRSGSEEDDDAGRRLMPRRIAVETVAALVARAIATLERLQSFSGIDRAGALAGRLDQLLAEGLGWSDRGWHEELRGQLITELARLPAEFGLEEGEAALLLGRVLDGRSTEAAGGRGSGVAVLGAMAARGRTFDHLYLLGLERGVFPRAVSEDPLLPDRARRRLRVVLPDLPVKGEGHAEERWLFASLLEAAEKVHLSWNVSGEGGEQRTPSPFVEVLRRSHRISADVVLERVPPLTAADVTRLAGVEGRRFDLANLLRPALDEALADGPELPGEVIAAWAKAIDQNLRIKDGPAARDGETAFLGFVGGGAPAEEVPVTTLEGLARCPWQWFLTRELGVDNALDPVAELPGVSPRSVGIVVHAVLQEIARAAGIGTDPGAEPRSVGWPRAEELERHLDRAMERLEKSEGVQFESVAVMLQDAARAHLQVARDEFWGAPVDVVAAEAPGRAELADGRRLGFRADRVDPEAIVDYKTGRPLTTTRTAKARRRHLLAAIQDGRALQAAAYAAGGLRTGRYVYLAPEWDEEVPRQVDVAADDAEARQLFTDTAAVLMQAHDSGIRLPRLIDGKGETWSACRTCSVIEACLQPDSGARQRLRKLLEEEEGGSGAELQVARALWARLNGREEEAP